MRNRVFAMLGAGIVCLAAVADMNLAQRPTPAAAPRAQAPAARAQNAGATQVQ